MSVVERIEEIRKIKKISMESLAESIGMSYQGYHKAIKTAKDIKVSDLIKIADLFNVSPSTFFDNKDSKVNSELHFNGIETIVIDLKDRTVKVKK